MFIRFLLGSLTVGGLIVAGRAYSTGKVIYPLEYADSVSKAFAAADNGPSNGWTQCVERADVDGSLIVLCEGTRTVQHDTGQLNNVNYFCEFQFNQKPGAVDYQVSYNLCQ